MIWLAIARFIFDVARTVAVMMTAGFIVRVLNIHRPQQ